MSASVGEKGRKFLGHHWYLDFKSDDRVNDNIYNPNFAEQRLGFIAIGFILFIASAVDNGLSPKMEIEGPSIPERLNATTLELKALAVFSPDAGCENSSLSLLLEEPCYLQTRRHYPQVKVPLGIDVPYDTGCSSTDVFLKVLGITTVFFVLSTIAIDGILGLLGESSSLQQMFSRQQIAFVFLCVTASVLLTVIFLLDSPCKSEAGNCAVPITSLDMLRQLTTVNDLTTCKGVTLADNSSFYSLQMKPMAKTVALNSSIRWQIFWLFANLYLWIFIAFSIGPPFIIRKPCVESAVAEEFAVHYFE